MTLIEAREALEPRILSKRQQELDSSPFDESGSDDEFLIASEGYPEDGENNNNRDFFSLPTLGLNYLNNLNLSLNLSLNLRNTPLWRIYENSSFTKPGFLSNYLGKHTDELELNEHDITSDSRGYFTITNFLRRHGFPSYEEDFSEEAILERVRFKKLQQQAAARTRKLVEERNIISDFTVEEKVSKADLFSESDYGEGLKVVATEEQSETDEQKLDDLIAENKIQCDTSSRQQEMTSGVSASPVLNPFYNRVDLSLWDKIKIGILFCIILPIKVVLMATVLCIALLLSLIGNYGITFEESQDRPLSRWRRGIRSLLANGVMRMFIICTGFVWRIKETGKRATPEEAPIFVVGPHSSYFDAFAVILLGAPSVVAKLSTKDIPVFGRLVTFTQAVYVSRESKGSRRQTMEVLKQRAQDVYLGSGMPQIFIFPEGTCANRSSLIKFKAGAFVPQVPVQPVLIRYPNPVDSCTWTFDGPPALRNICYTLSKLYNRIEIEYLPVYVPNEAEKNDSNLYAENVRKVMAEALDIPLSDYQFEDGMLLCAMRESKLVQKFRSIHRAKKALGLSGSTNEYNCIRQGMFDDKNYELGFHDFQREFFHVSSEDTIIPEVQATFNSFKGDNEKEVMDIRPYLILTCMLYEDKMLDLHDAPKEVCQMYGLDKSTATSVDIKRLIEDLFEASETDSGKPSQSQTNVQSDEIQQRISRILEFVKLFADEVTERLPKTYPSAEERDKLPKDKLKSD